MAGSVNKVILIGNLGRDPEVRTMQSGDKLINMSVATSENWKDRQTGERREKTEWHRVVIFDTRIADVAERYLKKGSKVYLEGTLQTRKWTGNDGVEKYTTEVVIPRFNGVMTMLDTRGGGGDGGYQGGDSPSWDNPPDDMGGGSGGGSGGGGQGGGSGGGSGGSSGGGPGSDLDDEIPF